VRRMTARTLLLFAALAGGLLLLAACNGDDAADATTHIEVTGTDGMRFVPDSYTVPAGEIITVELTAEAGVDHDFVIEELGDLEVVHADRGETATGTFSVDEPGTYTVYCAVPGHRTAGMVATLTVVGD
jgi:uncharacterized cupredoxin-like copper-binding protein